MREPQTYRDNLARLDEAAPGTELLTTADVMRVLGITRERANILLEGRLVCGKYISKATLAHLLSQ